MSSDDRLRLVEHPEGDSHKQNGEEQVVPEQGLQPIQNGSTLVRFSSRSPRLTTLANKTTTRGAEPRQANQTALLADAVYGDGNVFVTGERVKSARCGCNYVRAIIAILMLPIFVLLILAITGVLPIGFGLGTHDDAPAPPCATDSHMDQLQHVQKPHIVSTVNPHASHAQRTTDRQMGPGAGKKQLVDQQMLNNVEKQVAQAVNGAKPADVQRLMDTALNNAINLLDSAVSKQNPNVVQQAQEQLAEEALREAEKKALAEAQTNPKALLENVKNAVNNAGNGAALTAAKVSDAIRPGVVGPNDEVQEANNLRQEPMMMQDAPINQDEFNRILQNALRRRVTP